MIKKIGIKAASILLLLVHQSKIHSSVKKNFWFKMFKEIVILLCIVTVAWTQSCSVPPAGAPTFASVVYTAAAHWAGVASTSPRSTNRSCVRINGGALSITSNDSRVHCRLFADENCSTAHPFSFYADISGWSNTGTPVRSVSCPWRCTNWKVNISVH